MRYQPSDALVQLDALRISLFISGTKSVDAKHDCLAAKSKVP
jgi:hypothetical protein